MTDGIRQKQCHAHRVERWCNVVHLRTHPKPSADTVRRGLDPNRTASARASNEVCHSPQVTDMGTRKTASSPYESY